MVVLVKRLKETNPTEVLQAVPEDAVVFIENLDYEYISEGFVPGNRIWIDFVNTTARTGLDSLVHMVFTQVNLSEALQGVLMKEGLNISLHLVGSLCRTQEFRASVLHVNRAVMVIFGMILLAIL